MAHTLSNQTVVEFDYGHQTKTIKFILTFSRKRCFGVWEISTGRAAPWQVLAVRAEGFKQAGAESARSQRCCGVSDPSAAGSPLSLGGSALTYVLRMG